MKNKEKPKNLLKNEKFLNCVFLFYKSYMFYIFYIQIVLLLNLVNFLLNILNIPQIFKKFLIKKIYKY